jgi:hypothetical protein
MSLRQNAIKPGIEFPGKGSLNNSAMIEESRLLLAGALKELSDEPQ